MSAADEPNQGSSDGGVRRFVAKSPVSSILIYDFLSQFCIKRYWCPESGRGQMAETPGPDVPSHLPAWRARNPDWDRELRKSFAGDGELCNAYAHLHGCFGPSRSPYAERLDRCLGFPVEGVHGVTYEHVLHLLTQITAASTDLNGLLQRTEDPEILVSCCKGDPGIAQLVQALFEYRQFVFLHDVELLMAEAVRRKGRQQGVQMFRRAWAAVFIREVVDYAACLCTSDLIYGFPRRQVLAILHLTHYYRGIWAANVRYRDERSTRYVMERLGWVVQGCEACIESMQRGKAAMRVEERQKVPWWAFWRKERRKKYARQCARQCCPCLTLFGKPRNQLSAPGDESDEEGLEGVSLATWPFNY